MLELTECAFLIKYCEVSSNALAKLNQELSEENSHLLTGYFLSYT